MIAGRFHGLPTGPCSTCGAPTLTRARLNVPLWRRLLFGREPFRWYCPSCLGAHLERAGRHSRA